MTTHKPADIFLSYNREDQTVARRFAEGFEREGFTVWWDVTLRSGETYDQVTEDALRNAKAVVVLWSKKSVKSEWVRSEASIALRNKTLMPAMIELCDRPVMFELKQTADLIHWKGDSSDSVWRNFVADVRRLVTGNAMPGATTQTRAAAPTSPQAQRMQKPLLLGAAAVLAAAVGLFLFYSSPFSQESAPAVSITDTAAEANSDIADKSIAVLPFDDFSVGGEESNFVDGLTEEILTALSRAQDLKVASRNSSFQFKNQAVDVKAVAEQLGVAHVLEGSVRRSENRLRVTVQLIRAGDGFHLWSENYDRQLDDVIAVQEDIAVQIATAMKTAMDPAALRTMMQSGTQSVAAYNEYLLGLAVTQSAPNGELQVAGYQHFEQARLLDPGFAKAHAMAAQYWQAQLTPNRIRFREAQVEKLPEDAMLAAYQERLAQAVATARAPDLFWYQMQQAESQLNIRAAYGYAQQYLALDPDLKLQSAVGLGVLTRVIKLFGGKAAAVPLLLRFHENHIMTSTEGAALIANFHFVAAVEEGLQFSEAWLRTYPPREDVLYQYHRLLLMSDAIEQAKPLVDRINGSVLPPANMRMMRLRQACADKDLDTANRLYNESINAYRDDPNAGLFDGWLEMYTMGMPEEADQRLQPWDKPDSFFMLYTLTEYPSFNIDHFPNLKAALLQNNTPLPVYQPIPFACSPPAL